MIRSDCSDFGAEFCAINVGIFSGSIMVRRWIFYPGKRVIPQILCRFMSRCFHGDDHVMAHVERMVYEPYSWRTELSKYATDR